MNASAHPLSPASDPVVTSVPEHLFRPINGLTTKQVLPVLETILVRNAALLELIEAEPVVREALEGIAAQLRQAAELLQEVMA